MFGLEDYRIEQERYDWYLVVPVGANPRQADTLAALGSRRVPVVWPGLVGLEYEGETIAALQVDLDRLDPEVMERVLRGVACKHDLPLELVEAQWRDRGLWFPLERDRRARVVPYPFTVAEIDVDRSSVVVVHRQPDGAFRVRLYAGRRDREWLEREMGVTSAWVGQIEPEPHESGGIWWTARIDQFPAERVAGFARRWAERDGVPLEMIERAIVDGAVMGIPSLDPVVRVTAGCDCPDCRPFWALHGKQLEGRDG